MLERLTDEERFELAQDIMSLCHLHIMNSGETVVHAKLRFANYLKNKISGLSDDEYSKKYRELERKRTQEQLKDLEDWQKDIYKLFVKEN